MLWHESKLRSSLRLNKIPSFPGNFSVFCTNIANTHAHIHTQMVPWVFALLVFPHMSVRLCPSFLLVSTQLSHRWRLPDRLINSDSPCPSLPSTCYPLTSSLSSSLICLPVPSQKCAEASVSSVAHACWQCSAWPVVDDKYWLNERKQQSRVSTRLLEAPTNFEVISMYMCVVASEMG